MSREAASRRRPTRWTVAAACAVGVVGVAAVNPAVAVVPEAASRVVAAASPSHSHLTVAAVSVPGMAPGGVGTVSILLSNQGPERTASPFTVVVTLPVGAAATGPFFPESCALDLLGRRLTCSFPPGLRALGSATVLVPLQISAVLPPHSVLVGGLVHLDSADDVTGLQHDVAWDIHTA